MPHRKRGSDEILKILVLVKRSDEMKRNWYKLSVPLAAFLIFFGSVAPAEQVKVRDIKQNLPEYEDEVVSIEGSISKYVEQDKKTTNLYKLRDNWGETIFVRTSQALPDINKRWIVTGIVSREHNGMIYLSETSRTEVLTEKAPAAAPLKHSRESIDPVIKYLLVTTAAIFAVLVIVLIYMMTKRSRASEPAAAAAAALHNPIPADSVGKTVIMKKAPPGTLRLLPGKFIILRGDETHKEIRFQVPKDQTTKEFTFGRQEIPDQNPFGHIQLKEGTVSRLHAKVIYTPDGVSLINYSTVNPTTVNKKELMENETVRLEDGDIITMGEVEFQYGAK
jgi:FHA domain